MLQLEKKLNIEEEKLKQAFCRVIAEIAQQLPDTPILDQVRTFEIYIPHLSVSAISLVHWFQKEELIWPFLGLIRFYRGQGLYNRALMWSQQCLECVQSGCGEKHPDVATSLDNIAAIYRVQKNYENAKRLYYHALEIREYLFGEEHPEVATSLNNLANLYSDEGNYEEAKPFYLRALEVYEHSFGKDHLSTVTTLNNLGNLYRDQKCYEETETIYLEVLERRKHIFGNEHSGLAITLNNLATLYREQKRYEDAEPLYRQALHLDKFLLGEKHQHTHHSLVSLARLYRDWDKDEEAEPLYLEVIALEEYLTQQGNTDALCVSLYELYDIYFAKELFQQTVFILEKILRLERYIFGDQHVFVGRRFNELAQLHQIQGHAEKATHFYQKASQILQRPFGE
jgi:tetratricopeptide (TPR) repeat protein